MNRATELTTLIAAVVAAALAIYALATRPQATVDRSSNEAVEAKLGEIAELLRTIADAPTTRASDAEAERLAPVPMRQPVNTNDDSLRDAIERLTTLIESFETPEPTAGRDVQRVLRAPTELAKLRQRSSQVSEPLVRDLYDRWVAEGSERIPLEYATHGLHDWIEVLGWPDEYYVPNSATGRYRLSYSKAVSDLGFDELEVYCDEESSYLVMFDLAGD